MASTYLSKTLGTSTNTYKGTVSVWFKKSQVSSDQVIYGNYTSGTQRGKLVLASDSKLMYYQNDGGSVTIKLETTRLFRDFSAWYHVVLSVDTTQASSSDRVKLYVNGVQETAFDTATYPSQNTVFYLNANSVTNYIGQEGNSSDYWDGSMTHINVIDGTAYTASTFGETDSTSGIWKPKTAPSVTYGTNGFFLKFENSGNLDLDSSSNGHTFSTTGTITQTEDTPSNNFATWNPVSNARIESGTAYLPTFSNGNTTANNADSNYFIGAKSTIGVNAGKWYVEAKCSAVGGRSYIGLAPDDNYGEISATYLYENDGQINSSSYGNTYTTGDIIQIAFDADNGAVWFGKNGTWENSATQSEIEAGTTTNAGITGLSMTKFYHFATKGYNGSTFQANFGNGKFGTTSLASSNSDSAGLGLFEYTVPANYYSLCTKNIKNYG